MHPDIHLRLHELRAAELHREAATVPRLRRAAPRRALRDQLGWTLVEVGLRLVAERPPRSTRTARTARTAPV
ncbi:hypothetical protein [Streptomyces formicae]|uniref:Uncharacterized protein n=1 Tax=Streptomyces formicae TaxID=1616117 RepID=A0ABY3WS06_9ACTN|nr:hypothetical protein [Streptomyces formicae]UNM15407.1 hypothetical protein J4032_31620 [Streptomyces formicae]